MRRNPRRPADVVVEPIGAAPDTTRAVPHPHDHLRDSDPPSSTELALEPLNEAVETVHTGELLLDAADFGDLDEDDDRTPVTSPSPWQRLIPPPLPESN